MKNKTFKELSMIIIVFVLMCICVCSSVRAQYGDSVLGKLESRLGAYKDAFRSKDYVKAASFVSPNKINKIGGARNFAKIVQKFTESTIISLKPTLIEFSKPEEIVFYNNMYISVVKKIIPVTTKGIDEEVKEAYLLFNPGFPAIIFEGMDGVFNLSIVAYSEDEGNTWFFTGGNRAGLQIANIDTEILEKIRIPVPTLIFGEGDDIITLVRQNRRWVKKVSEISESLSEENIILTMGEQMEDSRLDATETGIPDDSLDESIYFEEHPVELTGLPGGLAKPIQEDNTLKENESVQESSKDISYSVFVTKESNIFHKPDCPELSAGDLLGFDSSQEALEAGGVPCRHCNP